MPELPETIAIADPAPDASRAPTEAYRIDFVRCRISRQAGRVQGQQDGR